MRFFTNQVLAFLTYIVIEGIQCCLKGQHVVLTKIWHLKVQPLSSLWLAIFMASRTHYLKGAIDWSLLKTWVPGIIVGAWLGGVVASYLDGQLLQKFFAGFLVFVGLSMWFAFAQDKRTMPPVWECGLVSTLVGTVSSLFGVGGGSLTVPYLRYCSLPMARAVATD